MQPGFLSQTIANMGAIVPELFLSLAILLVIFYDLFLPKERSHRSAWVALAGVAGALVLSAVQWRVASAAGGMDSALWFSGTIANDRFSIFFKILFYAATAATVLMSRNSAELRGLRAGEYYALLLTATLGAAFMVSSANLLMLVLSFETLSLSSYVLAGYRKGVRQAAEASLKYVLFGSVASGVMLYGISLLYGLAGSLQFDALAQIPSNNYGAFMLTMALVLVGFGFKMSMVPFHFWAPDVYEGSPTAITAYLSVVSKAAGFAALVRLIAPFFGVVSVAPYTSEADSGMFANQFDLAGLFWIAAVLTMIVGNLVALRQTDIKRLLAYSSIAHAGYLLTAFVSANASGFHAILFYFVVYFIANLGLFMAVILVHNQTETFRIADYRGLFFKSPVFAVCVTVLLWSLIGLPPSAGFVGKWKLFYSVIQRGQVSPNPYFYYSLVLIALITSVVSLYYYIAIVKVMCFYSPDERSERFAPGRWGRAVMIAFALPILLIQFNWQPITGFVLRAMNTSWEEVNRAAAAGGARNPAVAGQNAGVGGGAQ